MHFFGVYALARAAGIKPRVARIIAYASQFVDDAMEDEAIVLEDQSAILPTMTSHRPIDYQNTIPGDQWRVWVPFHFLPGNEETAQTFVEKMVCRKDSYPARKMLKHALQHRQERFGPHLAGITAHVYADTFSHYGFVGLSRDWNRVKSDSIKVYVSSSSILNYIHTKFETFKTRVAGTLAEVVPVGHGAVATYPDRPYLHWEYEYENGGRIERHNVDDYIEACERLHDFFSQFIKGNTVYGDSINPISWDSIADKVRDILKHEGPLDERINLWKNAISSNELFVANEEDRGIAYSEKEWRSSHIVYHFAAGGDLDGCDGCMFIRAAWKHRDYVLHTLLPDIGVIVC